MSPTSQSKQKQSTNMKPKSDRELTIKFRNKIAARIIEAKANILYWKSVYDQSRYQSSQFLAARDSIKLNEDNIKKDKVFLDCIDKMLNGGKK